MSWVDDVRSFHLVSQQPLGLTPGFPDMETRQTRIKLLVEEINEYMTAEREEDIVDVADGIGDIIYILIGTAVAYGIPLDAVWDEVQLTNMAKSVNGRCEYKGYKIVKPEGWIPPDIAGILEKARS